MNYTTTGTNTSFGVAYNFTINYQLPPDDGLAGVYAVLGVPPNSPPDVVRKAYRAKLQEVHPDHGGSEEATRRVIDAYQRIVN